MPRNDERYKQGFIRSQDDPYAELEHFYRQEIQHLDALLPKAGEVESFAPLHTGGGMWALSARIGRFTVLVSDKDGGLTFKNRQDIHYSMILGIYAPSSGGEASILTYPFEAQDLRPERDHSEPLRAAFRAVFRGLLTHDDEETPDATKP